MSKHIRICNGPYCRSTYEASFPERLTEVGEHQALKGNTSEISKVCLQVCARLRPVLLDELDLYGSIRAHVLVQDTEQTHSISGVVLSTPQGLMNKKV